MDTDEAEEAFYLPPCCASSLNDTNPPYCNSILVSIVVDTRDVLGIALTSPPPLRLYTVEEILVDR